MSTINPSLGRALAGAGGALLIASLFLSWSEDGGATRTGWETLGIVDVFFLLTGVCGIAAAMTGGRFGFFRPDLSFNAMTDIFGVMASVLLGWLILFDTPSEARLEAGVYLALAAALVIATGAGDFRVRTLFPRVPEGDRAK